LWRSLKDKVYKTNSYTLEEIETKEPCDLKNFLLTTPDN